APGSGEHPDGSAWPRLWGALGTRYRHVVVDAGSLRGDAAHRWAGWVRHTVLVVDTSRVTREMLESFRRERQHGGPALSGFLLNKRRSHVPARLYRAFA